MIDCDICLFSDPPSEISELQNENVSIGKDVVLKCVSYANPRPSYRWIYHQTSNVRIVDEDGVSRLHITNADGENTGTYMCIVTNVLGIKNKTVRVDVQGKASGFSIAVCDIIQNMINYSMNITQLQINRN